MAMKFPCLKMIWITESKARLIRQYICLQDLGDVVIRDMGIVRNPLGDINNRSIDVYPLQFIKANRVGVKTRALFPVVKTRVHEQKWKGKEKLEVIWAQGMTNSAPVIREGKWASLWECHPRGEREIKIDKQSFCKVMPNLEKTWLWRWFDFNRTPTHTKGGCCCWVALRVGCDLHRLKENSDPSEIASKIMYTCGRGLPPIAGDSRIGGGKPLITSRL